MGQNTSWKNALQYNSTTHYELSNKHHNIEML